MSDAGREERELLSRLRGEGARRFFKPAALLAAFFFGLFVGALLSAFLLPPERAFALCRWLLSLDVAAFAIVSSLALLRPRPTRPRLAAELDDASEAKSRMEAFLELRGTDNHLRAAQAADAHSFYKKAPGMAWPASLALLLFLCLLFFAGQGALLFSAGVAVEKARAVERLKEKAGQAKEKRTRAVEKAKEDFASLEIQEPEPETRARPADEILVRGVGSSSGGFSSLLLAVSVNGEAERAVAIENPPLDSSGGIAFEGALDLDALAVEPFDLVSYHFKGESVLGGVKKEIVSQPQYIQARPFREDAVVVGGIPGEMRKMLDWLYAMLASEISLNKALFTAMGSGLAADDKTLLEQLALLAKEQGSLRDDLKWRLFNVDPKLMTPNMFEHAGKAVERMGEAVSALASGDSKRAPEMRAADLAQRGAISELIVAMKEVRKAMIQANGAGAQSQAGNDKRAADPFKDKQSYKRPPMPPSENLENQLADALREESDLASKLEALRKAEDDGSAAKGRSPATMKDIAAKQAGISRALAGLSGREGLEKEGKSAIEDAARASGSAEEALKSGGPRDSAPAVGKAGNALKDALESLRAASALRMEKALEEAQKELNEASRELASGKRAEAASKIDQAASEIEKEALRQHKAGSQARAESLAGMAELFDAKSPARKLRSGGDGKAAAKDLAELKEALASFRESLSNRRERLADAAKRMERAAKELESAAKRPAAASKEELKAMAKDAELALDDALRASSSKEGAPSGKSGSKSSDEAGWEKDALILKPKFDNVLAYPEPSAVKSLAADLKKFLPRLLSRLDSMKGKESMRDFKPDEVPKIYREDVSDYFKRLSEN